MQKAAKEMLPGISRYMSTVLNLWVESLRINSREGIEPSTQAQAIGWRVVYKHTVGGCAVFSTRNLEDLQLLLLLLLRLPTTLAVGLTLAQPGRHLALPVRSRVEAESEGGLTLAGSFGHDVDVEHEVHLLVKGKFTR